MKFRPGSLEKDSLLFLLTCQRTWTTAVGAIRARRICSERLAAGMRPFKWQLLVMVQPVREKGLICRHRYLRRLNETLKLFNTLENFLHTGQVSAVGLRLPGLQNFFTHLRLQCVKLPRKILLPASHGCLGRFIEFSKPLIKHLTKDMYQVFPG